MADERIAGVVTNRDYLVGILRSDEFLRGDTTTAFVEQVLGNLSVALSRMPGVGQHVEPNRTGSDRTPGLTCENRKVALLIRPASGSV